MIPKQSTPFGVWLVSFFCVTLLMATAFFQHRQKEEAVALKETAAAKHTKAAELSKEGFEMLRQQKRNQLYARCKEDGNYPLLFIDKIVCVKPDAIAWVKYDGNPEQDTSGDEQQP